MLPTLVFVIAIFAVLLVGAGCSALTGVEAIANGVPSFCNPAVRRAQRTELTLGLLLGIMLVGLAVLIRAHHVVPRGGVTVLAQLTAGAFGTGWPFYVSNLSVTLILALAANTSFGGLPVLMSLLARDHRLPHVFGLRRTSSLPLRRGRTRPDGRRAADRPRRRHLTAAAAVRGGGLHRLHHQPGGTGRALDPEPPPGLAGDSQPGLVVVPVATINAATTRALSAARGLGDHVVAVTADTGTDDLDDFRRRRADWNPGVQLVVVPSPNRGLVAPLLGYVNDGAAEGRQVTVLIVELQPQRRRYRILHNQRGLILATVLRARTDAVVATLPFRL